MEWIKNIVQGLIETYNTRNIYDLIDSLDIMIIRKELQNGLKAKFFRDMFGNEFIYLASNINESEEKYLLAHEVGHAILHTDISVEYYYNSLVNTGKLEKQADYFAVELLIDEANIDKQILLDMNIEQLSSYFGIPIELIEYKFSQNYFDTNF